MKKELGNKKITYKIRFIDSLRFIVSSLSDLADNLAEGLHDGKWVMANHALSMQMSKMVFCSSVVKTVTNIIKKNLTKF